MPWNRIMRRSAQRKAAALRKVDPDKIDPSGFSLRYLETMALPSMSAGAWPVGAVGCASASLTARFW